jgi:hypothetical protein
MSQYIARRIPSPLAGAESCGPDQQWDPNFTFNGIKGQCVPKGTPMTPASGVNATLDAIVKAISSNPFAPKPAAAPASYAAPAKGMSQNTMIAIGLGAVGLIALVTLARK